MKTNIIKQVVFAVQEHLFGSGTTTEGLLNDRTCWQFCREIFSWPAVGCALASFSGFLSCSALVFTTRNLV